MRTSASRRKSQTLSWQRLISPLRSKPSRFGHEPTRDDTPHLEVKGELTGPNVRQALAKHVLAQASLTGTYSLNPHLSAKI